MATTKNIFEQIYEASKDIENLTEVEKLVDKEIEKATQRRLAMRDKIAND